MSENDRASLTGRYARWFDSGLAKKSAAEFMAKLEESRRTGVLMDASGILCGRPSVTNEQRLSYYRSHGLVSCDDYPGGDVAFEADVLSGAYHDFEVVAGPPKREDAYVIQCMYDGRFRYDSHVTDFIWHPELTLAFHDTCLRNGIAVSHNYPGGPIQFRKDVLSGEYARMYIRECDG